MEGDCVHVDAFRGVRCNGGVDVVVCHALVQDEGDCVFAHQVASSVSSHLFDGSTNLQQFLSKAKKDIIFFLFAVLPSQSLPSD